MSTFGVDDPVMMKFGIHGREPRRFLNQLQDHTWSERNVELCESEVLSDDFYLLFYMYK